MDWELRLYKPTGRTPANLKATVKNTVLGPISGPMRFSCARSGDCLQMEFTARNDLLGAAPLDHVQLLLDLDGDGTAETAVWLGYVVEAPALADRRAQTIRAQGLRGLLKRRLVTDADTTGPAFAATIIRNLYNAHAADLFSATSLSISGGFLGGFAAPAQPLDKTLDELAALGTSAIQVYTGVSTAPQVAALGDGTLSVKPPGGSLSLSYAQTAFQWLPVIEQDTVTAVSLVWGQAANGVMSYSTTNPAAVAQYGELWAAYEAPPTLLTTSNPDGVAPMKAGGTLQQYRQSDGTWTAWDGSAAQLWDGNTNTVLRAAQTYVQGSAGQALNYTVGVKATWSSAAQVNGYAGVYIRARNPGGSGLRIYAEYHYGNPSTGGVFSSAVYVASDFDGFIALERGAYLMSVGVGIELQNTNSSADVQVAEIQPYRWATSAESYAQAQMKVPAARPAEVVVQGYRAPVADVTVTGAPGGDLTGPAGEFEYTLDPALGAITTIRLGQLGASLNPVAAAVDALTTEAASRWGAIARGLTLRNTTARRP